MNYTSVIEAKNVKKKFKSFQLDVPILRIPKGFATALIGANGAGKSTLLNILAGIRLDYDGDIFYFDEKVSDVDEVRAKIGYTGPGLYFFHNWRKKQITEIYQVLFDDFDSRKFEQFCYELQIYGKEEGNKGKKAGELSDGNRMKLEIAGVLSRNTKCLIMDEPASPLDPLMRERLCGLLHDYIAEGDGERSVVFSTHNITDMESVTDYAVMIADGKIAEQGFVEDLKEKYLLVKGNEEESAKAEKILYTINKGPYGFEGICFAEDADRLAGLNVSVETPTLSQISVAVMKEEGR